MPPAFHYSLPGVSLEMGPVVGVRDNSAAEKAGVKPNDILKEVELADRKTGEQARFVFHSGKNEAGQDVKVVGDPLRLAHALRQWCQDRPSVGVVLTVGRVNEETHKAFDPTRLAQVDWDSSWRFDEEVSLGPPSPAAVPELGLAYQVKTTIARVEPGSAGEAAGLRKDDVILEVNVRKPALKATEPSFGKDPFKLWTEQKVEGDADKRRAEAWWPYVPAYINHRADYKDVELLVKRAGSDDQRIQLSFQPDTTWPSADPGLDLLITQSRLQRAANMGEAIRMGGHRTFQSIVQVYQGLKSMITGRLPFMANASGPIGIAAVAHTLAGRDMVMFVLFLGLISVNLAVVNFLPIPVLDGGHMVFLLYEKLRGKPASERVREATTYAGVAIILTLMLVVVFVDVKKLLSW
jgi:regulator of sigma E protease